MTTTVFTVNYLYLSPKGKPWPRSAGTRHPTFEAAQDEIETTTAVIAATNKVKARLVQIEIVKTTTITEPTIVFTVPHLVAFPVPGEAQ